MYKFLLTAIFLLLLVGLLHTPNYIPEINDVPDLPDYQIIKSDSTVAAILETP